MSLSHGLRRVEAFLMERLSRSIAVHVADESGERREYRFSIRAATAGLAVGSDPACHIRLTGLDIRPVHARLQPLSNHWVLKHLPDGQRLPLPRTFEGDYDTRVDRTPFEIGRYRLQITD